MYLRWALSHLGVNVIGEIKSCQGPKLELLKTCSWLWEEIIDFKPSEQNQNWVWSLNFPAPTLDSGKWGQSPSFPIVLYFIVLMWWSLLPNALWLFKDLLCSSNLGISRKWICRLNFSQRPIFSGLRFFNEPESSDSGLTA